ncbi:MAG: SoxR reducing system RseC family protein [Thermodesulfovibrionales bacterium]|nr:SoxR reducing system RseC family protein [Thermodesulfovibrionales bacterium]
MKPEIAENGMVIRLDGDNAVIMLESNRACKGCGAAKMGLCKPNGGLSIISAKNSAGAHIGDIVKIGIDSNVRFKGYLFSFIIPLFSLLGGSLAGYFIAQKIFFPGFDVITGFTALILASFYSFKRLKALDRSSYLVIESRVSECQSIRVSEL